MMSKRSRKDFEGIEPQNDLTIDLRETKRIRKNNIKNNIKNNNSNNNSPAMSRSTPGLSEIECPVCYEEFSSHIYQCVEGHLLCHICRPKFVNCPTCRVSLSSNIRNRILEQLILSTKPSTKPSTNSNTNNNNNSNKSTPLPSHYYCTLCNKLFLKLKERNEHYNICEHRLIKCPFYDCKWIDKFSKFCIHAQQSHHTSLHSKQPINIINNNNNNERIYKFNHAIKFPKDTFERENADFVWPKIVTFNDGENFFIKSRFNNGYVTVFVRLIKLIKLSKNYLNNLAISYLDNGLNNKNNNDLKKNILGKYFIELRIKKQNKDKDDNNILNNDFNNIPLRWPCDLYPIQLPFDSEKNMQQILNVHHSIFTNYWIKENSQSCGVLRFQFQAILNK